MATLPPIAIISDCHLHAWSAFSKELPDGRNSRLVHILDAIENAAQHLVREGGKTLYITGDLFHVRGAVSPSVLNPTITLFKQITADGVRIRILAGNHDLETRDSAALGNACETLRTIEGVEVISEPTLFEDDKVAMVPWYDKIATTSEKIEALRDKVDAKYGDLNRWSLMIHAPVNGVLINIPDHGFWPKELEAFGFECVFSGHYHNHKEFDGNVYSVGATTHQTWNDVNTRAGYLIVDTDVGVQFFESKAPKFIDYDLTWEDDEAIEKVTGNYVRVRLGAATDEEVTLIRDHINGLGAAGVLVQCIPTPKTSATSRTASVASAVTVRDSINAWIKANSTIPSNPALTSLCEDILNEVESVTV